jgi:hypothetical protein
MISMRRHMRQRYADEGARPKLNYSQPAPVNWIKEKAHPDDVDAPSVHVHAADEDLQMPDHEERLSNVEQAVLRLIREAYEEGAEAGEAGDDMSGTTQGTQAGHSPVRSGPPEAQPEAGDRGTPDGIISRRRKPANVTVVVSTAITRYRPAPA